MCPCFRTPSIFKPRAGIILRAGLLSPLQILIASYRYSRFKTLKTNHHILLILMVECSRRTLCIFLFAFLAAVGTITSAGAAPVPNGNSETSGDPQPAYKRAMSRRGNLKYQNKQDEMSAHAKALDIVNELQELLKLLPKGSEHQVKPEIIKIFDKETIAERIEVVTNGPMYQYANEAQRSLFKGKNTPSLSDELDIELWEVLTRIAEASPPSERRDYISWAVQRLSTLQSF
ncbi:hypothetical protein C8R42DRAFT_57530 [Lentinula raphanica]|nr:hypothetical protein C8R42DRAFT_57530 [Lentinula raphanica]